MKKNLTPAISLLILAAVFFNSCSEIVYIQHKPQYSESVQKWAYIFDPSVLSYDERLSEFHWFEYVSSGLKGIKIQSTAENIETHYWESQFLAEAFEELTGITVNHVIQGEGDVVLGFSSSLIEGFGEPSLFNQKKSSFLLFNSGL